jgi:hypothetical protein
MAAVSFDDLATPGAAAAAPSGALTFDDLPESAKGGTFGLVSNTQTPGKLLGPSVPMLSDDGGVNAFYKDAAGKLWPTNNTKHMVAGGNVYERQDGEQPTTPGDIGNAALIAAKHLPIVGPMMALPQASQDFWSGKPGSTEHMSDTLSGMGVTGTMSGGGFPRVTPAPAKVLSDAGQTAHDAIADAIRSAKTSGNVRSVLRKSFGAIKNDDDVMSSLSTDQKTAVGDLANTQIKKSPVETSDLAILALEPVAGAMGLPGIPSGLLASRAALRKFSNNRGDKSALSSAEKLRQSVIDNDPGADANPAPAPTLPDPGQLKLQMKAFEDQRSAVAQRNAEAQTQSTLQAQALLRQLAAQNKPAPDPLAQYGAADLANQAFDRRNQSEQVRDATRLMAARQAAQKLQASQTPPAPVDPMSQFAAADQANAAFDARNQRQQAQEATQLMAARRANQMLLQKAQAAKDQAAGIQQAQGEAQNSPLIQDVGGLDAVSNPAFNKQASQYLGAAKALKAFRAQPAEAAEAAPETLAQPAASSVAPPVAPAAPMPTPPPPIPAGISKKNGVVKETPAPQAEAPPEAPAEPPRSDYGHLPLPAAAHLITQRAFAKGKQIGVTPEEYSAGVLEKLRAKDSIADDLTKAMPAQEYQDISEHLQGAKTKADALDVMNHYIKLHPEAEPAIRLAMAKKRLNAGWKR